MLRGTRAWMLVVSAVAATVAVAGMAACTATEPGPATATTATTFDRATAARLLVSLADLRDMGVFGFDVREQPVVDPKQFSLSTLRGPCGATLDGASLGDGVLAVRRSTIALIVEAVAQPGPQAATGFTEAARADLRRGCPSFSETIGGAPAEVRLLEEIRLPELGDERVAWVQEVTDTTGRVGQRVVIVERAGGRLVFAVVLADRDLDRVGIHDLAVLAARAAFGDAAGPGATGEVRRVGSIPPGTAGSTPPGTGPGGSVAPGTTKPSSGTTRAASAPKPSAGARR